MAIALNTLVQEADRFLNAARIADYCPNGLQVEGRPQVRRNASCPQPPAVSHHLTRRPMQRPAPPRKPN